MGVLAETCDRIAVMYAGRIVETGSVEAVFGDPQHPYTKRLLDSLPVIGGRRGIATPIPGAPPDPGEPPSGCRFHPRCPYVREAHRKTEPQLEPIAQSDDHAVACLLDTGTRKKLWRDLQAGAAPIEAREQEIAEPIPADIVADPELERAEAVERVEDAQ